MKLFLIALSLMISSAFAAEIKVLDVKHDFRNADVKSHFYIKAGSDVVYVSSQVEEAIVYGDQMSKTDYYRNRVPGLSFDMDSRLITYTKDGVETVCALVVPRGVSIFRHNRIYNRDCKFKSKVTHDRAMVWLVTK